MSLSTQDRPQNPSKYFLKVSLGTVSYYDKESAGNIDVPLPLEFIVLDQLGTIKGFSAQEDIGFWSNEVRASGKEPFTVKTKTGTKATGIWKEIKNEPALAGAKFNASVYLAHKSGDSLVMSNIAFQGAALNAWIEFIQANKGVMNGKNKAVLSGFKDGKKGSVKYKVPVFEVADVTDEEIEAAKELDKKLQAYLGEYFGYKSAEDAPRNSVVEDIVDDAINLDDIPF